MGEPDKILWRGVRPTSPEGIFTRYEVPDDCEYVQAYNHIENDTLSIYEVPATQILYLTSFMFSVTPSGVAGFGWMYVRNEAETTVAVLSVMDCFADLGNSVVGNFNIALKCESLSEVMIASEVANVVSYGTFIGYLRTP